MQPRRSWLKQLTIGVAAITVAPFNAISSLIKPFSMQDHNQINTAAALKLGAFSISLNVKNLTVSKEFYEKLGFTVFAGSMNQNYLIMKNGNALVGLFQGMFTNNILTFNPGWDENAKKLDSFDDVRKIQQELKKHGLKLDTEADEKTSGPGSILLMDPDGNPVLIDQHV